jgi:MFS family permease
LSGLLIPLNSTMIAVALPRIAHELHASVVQTGWLVTLYLIVMASLQPIAGKLGDRYGRRPFILGGVVAFALASIGAALSTGVWTLMGFRAGQAVAGAIILPSGAALLRDVVAESRRGAMYGMLGASISLGAALGPSVGGALVGLGGWPAIFWINVPLVAVIYAVGRRTVPSRRPEANTVRFDVRGAVMLACLLAFAAFLLTRLGRLAAGTAVLGVLVVAIGLGAFVWLETRHRDPVVEPRFFRRPPFAASTTGIALSNVAMYSILLAVPLLLERRPGWSAARVGGVLTAMFAGMVVLGPLGGRIGDRFGRRLPALSGMAVLSAGLVMLALAGDGVSTRTLIVGLALAGIGLGAGSSSLQTVAIESVPAASAGMAAAASATARYVGSIVGTSVLGALLVDGGGFRTLFTMTADAAIGAAVLALPLPGRRRAYTVELATSGTRD